MPHPPILYVDKNDQPVGSGPVDQADKNGYVRRLVRLMLENSSGQILLQKRSLHEPVYPGRWDNSVAGHVDKDETNELALAREAAEEIGIQLIDFEKIGSYYNETMRLSDKVRKWNHVYKVTSDSTPTNLSEEEVDSVKWFSVSEIKDMIENNPDDFTDGVIEVIRRFY